MVIYDITGNVLLDIEVDDTSVRYKAIKGENSLTLKFALDEHIEVPIGSFCMFKGETYSLMLPEDLMMKHRRNFEYTLVMHSEDAKSKRYKFINPVDGRLKFSLTAKPIEHLQMFVDNMNARDEGGWEVKECPDHVEITLSYNHTSCHDALVQLADELELDYWFIGKGVYLGNLELYKENPLPLSYGGDGEGLKQDIKRVNYSDALPIEVLYIQGGTSNIDPSKYGSPELHLPVNYQTIGYDGLYFEDEAGYDASKARHYQTDADGRCITRVDKVITYHSEDSLDCSDIYPTKTETVEDVIVADKEKHFYDILFNSNVDYSQYIIEGENATIVFQSGMLAGKEFDLATDENGNLVCRKEGELWRVEIVPQEIDGITMPDEASGYLPAAGNTFKVFGIQLPEEYLSDNDTKSGAEWDMFRTAVKHFYANEGFQYTISGNLDEIYAKKNWNRLKDRLVLGSYISFSDRSFQTEPLLIRITGIKEFVNKPYSPQLEISNAAIAGTLVGTINRIENQEAHTEAMVKDVIAFSKRRWRNAKETINMLQGAISGFSEGIDPITVETMAMLVGDERLQFIFTQSLDSDETADFSYIYKSEPDAEEGEETEEGSERKNQLILNSAFIKHMTLGIDSISPVHSNDEYKRWALAEESFELDPEKGYYIYAEVSKTDQSGTYIVSDTKQDNTDTHYRLLIAIANKEDEDKRSIITLYGFSEILPGRITTDRIVSSDGKTWLDLLKGVLHLNNMAGVSGVKTNEKGDQSIAAWFGGLMKDIELDEDKESAAKSVIRHDGTGYFADGLFSWDRENGISLGGGQIKINYAGSIEFEEGIKISAEGDETLGTVLNGLSELNKLWYLDGDGNLVTDCPVMIKNSLVVEDDTSSGGEGDPSTTLGTVTGIKVDDTTYKPDSSGLIDLSEILDNVNVDLSEYYKKDEANALFLSVAAADTKYASLADYTNLKADFDHLNMLLSSDTSDYIRTWEEVVSFLDGYKDEENLATILSSINGRIDTIETWSKYIIYDEVNNAVRISVNLIVEGDTSSGGEGDSTTSLGTVTGIKVSDTLTLDPDSYGIIDMSEVLANLNVSVDMSDFYTKTEVDAKFDGIDLSSYITSETAESTYQKILNEDNKLPYLYLDGAPTSLKSPFALMFGEQLYDGSSAKTITASDLGALTSHQAIYALTIKNSSGAAQIVYTPNTGAETITLTKSMVGLSNVDNTADANKRVSYANTAGSAPASDVYSWAKASSKPSYTYSEVGVTAAVIKSLLGTTTYAPYDSNGYLSLGGGTLTGDLRLKTGGGNYGSKLRFGDGDYAYIHEASDDILTIYGSGGLRLNTSTSKTVTVNGNEVITTANIGTQSVNYATSAGSVSSVAWSNVTGRPDSLSDFKNDAGFITSSSLSSYLLKTGGTITGSLTVNNYVGIGTSASSSYRLYVSGNTYISGSLIATSDTSSGSDIRFKDIIEDILLDLDFMADAPLFTFRWNDRDDDSIHMGTSAQYWERKTKGLVFGDLFKTLSYGNLGVAMAKSLAVEVRALRKELKQLKRERYGC